MRQLRKSRMLAQARNNMGIMSWEPWAHLEQPVKDQGSECEGDSGGSEKLKNMIEGLGSLTGRDAE